jgi:hypothetical protein
MKICEVQMLLPRRGKSIKYIRSIEISLSEKSKDRFFSRIYIDRSTVDRSKSPRQNKSIDRLRIFQKDLQMSAAFCVAQIHPQVLRS